MADAIKQAEKKVAAAEATAKAAVAAKAAVGTRTVRFKTIES